MEPPDELAERFIISASMLPRSDRFSAWLLTQRTRMAGGEGVYWCIADADTDSALGGIQVDQLGIPAIRGTGSLGYWLTPEARGRGVLRTALDAVIEHAFAERADMAGHSGLGLDRLWAGTDAANHASQRALRRAGFLEVLTERRVLTPDGEPPRDAISFELLATDDRAAQATRPAPPTVLSTERLRLRPWRETDRPREGPDEAALQNMPSRAMPTPETWDAWLPRRNRLRDTGTHDFCIADLATDEALGDISVFGIDRAVGHGELGYWLYPSARGKGYLDEAIEAVVTHAFTSEDDGGAGLNRLHAETNPDNFASRAALLRAGFRHWGDDHQAYVMGDGEPLDGAYYELLRAWRDEPSLAVSVPTIEGESVRLRPWRTNDSPRLVEACTDPLTRHWLAGLPSPYDEDVARAYVHSSREEAARGASINWCIADRDTDVALACLTLSGLRGPRPSTAAIGYWALPDARGRGVVTEALGLAIDHAFASADAGGLDRRRLVLMAADGNDASQAVARRHGFVPNGTDHDAEILGDGSRVDLHRFELLRAKRDATPSITVPVVEGTQVRLRPWQLADAPRIVEACSDAESRHWLANLPTPYTTDTAADYVRHMHERAATGATVGWCVADLDSDLAVGSLSVMDLLGYDKSHGEIGYWTHPDARGRGLMTEAVGLAVEVAFRECADGGLGRRRLSLNVAAGNDASVAIARRHHFVRVGSDRSAEPLGDGSYVDLLRFDRLRD